MKNKKLLSLLVLGLMVTGCDVEALPNDYEETYGAIKMEDVYDTVRNGKGEAALYNNLINLIAEKEITAAGRLNASAAYCQNTLSSISQVLLLRYVIATRGVSSFSPASAS